MIFETTHQLNIFLIFIFFGIIIGLFSIIYFSFFAINFAKKIKKIILNCVFYSIFSVFFANLLFFYNFGTFSPTLLLSYIGSYLSVKFLTRKSVVLLEKKWYTTLNKLKRTKQKEAKHDQSKES